MVTKKISLSWDTVDVGIWLPNEEHVFAGKSFVAGIFVQHEETKTFCTTDFCEDSKLVHL